MTKTSASTTNGKDGGIVRPPITKRGVPSRRPVRLQFNAAGVTFENRQAILEMCAAHNVRSCTLRPDPVPDVDPNAISVNVDLEGALVRVGYVPQRLTDRVRPGQADVEAIDTFTPRNSTTPVWYCKILAERV